MSVGPFKTSVLLIAQLQYAAENINYCTHRSDLERKRCAELAAPYLPRVKVVDGFRRHVAVKSQTQHVVDTASYFLKLATTVFSLASDRKYTRFSTRPRFRVT